MPPLDRRLPHTRIDPEVLALFLELEAVPKRRRNDRDFERRAYQLAQKLGLGSEHFCQRCSVLDRGRGPCWPPAYIAHDVWYQVREVRLRLLEAAKSRQRFHA
jgi:hypothetical protein